MKESDLAHMIDTFMGSVQTWECDAMGHMNVKFYVARAGEGLDILAHAIGLGPAQARAAGAGLVARDQHLKFLREMRAGAPFAIRSAVLAADGDGVRAYQEFRDPVSGALLATSITDAGYVDLATREARTLPPEARERAAARRIELPQEGRPRGLALDPPRPSPDTEEAEAMETFATYQGVVAPGECDAQGFMATPGYIARVSEAIPMLVARARGEDRSADPRVGGAAVEYRLVYRRPVRAGDILVLRSGLSAIGRKVFTWGHWLFDVATGEAVMTAEAVALMLDLETRKAMELAPQSRAAMEAILVPEMSV